VFPNLFCCAAPLLSNENIWRHPWLVSLGIKIKELKQMAAPLAPIHGTLVCRSTRLGATDVDYLHVDPQLRTYGLDNLKTKIGIL